MDKKDDGAKSGNVAQSGCTGSVTGNMVAPGTGGAVQIPRDAFEANTKAYFDNLHNKDKATNVIEHLQVAFQDQTLALYQFTSTSY
ncbi:PREDICTED: uncharacterized protein LOC106329019 [Brassica oleracea var. oleracea]|uniref:uncharacterized protein LOC106329019 n=1 Tax=Brassica oleracea var. oleracea TaxID=109376 RepID=UPI0006A6BDDF|nr:PREDICTED: uncharacterized protein LOC106329019 [Brassica oleracea var. oleracea]